jgi:ABC-type polysaccharide/polyol phosphate transport system ATPase subunit
LQPDDVISVAGLCKDFRLRGSATRSLKSAALDFVRGRRGRTVFHALADVGFTVRRGETLGIIGVNGAGKSTLLALITGTMTPTSGRIETRGAISALLELGAGFHPELTGRENVFLYGAVMGLSRRQMADRFERIVAFAGIERFIDQPVKHYSSGMYVRLGFAVAVEVDPDILLIDEVLAVGDAEFQRKCVERIADFHERGKTMLIISHDLPTIQSVSDRILFLEDGRVHGLGDPAAVVGEYRALLRQRSARGLQREWGTGEVRITGVRFFDAGGRATDVFQWGQPLEARIEYQAEHPVQNPVFGFAVADQAGRLIYGNNTQIEGCAIAGIAGRGAIRLRLASLPVARGTYLFSFSVHSADHKTNYHRLDNAFPIAVESASDFEGCCYMPVRWALENS